MLNARERLARSRARPLLVDLHRALSRLTSVLTAMNTGAHPDDEQSGMLAVLRFDLGMRVIVACSTRGEGGQNSLGPERSGALGVLRTRELEEAARVLDADIAWLGFGPDDPVHDFGFSKSGVDTLARWGRKRLLERLVRAYRRDRPDIVISTFLDVPGQHGHHRAMTEAAELAVALAADPDAFREHLAEGLTLWQVAKFYLPAWSGGGGTYDDEVPPPSATTHVTASGPDPATGAAYAEIGEWSRTFHASQGMGRWSPQPTTRWPLHLKLGPPGAEGDIRANLPATLGALGGVLGGSAAAALLAADAAVAQAVGSFPDRGAIIEALVAAAGCLTAAGAGLTSGQSDRHRHRLDRKLVEIDAALVLAAGISTTTWAEPVRVVPGGTATLAVHVAGPDGIAAGVQLRLPAYVTAGDAAFVEGVTRVPLRVAADAPLSSPFADTFSSVTGNGALRVALDAEIGGRAVEVILDLEEPIAIVPAHSVSVEPEALVVPVGDLPTSAAIAVRVEGAPAMLALGQATGLSVALTPTGFSLDFGREFAPGRHSLPVLVDGAQARQLRSIVYPHVGNSTFTTLQSLEVLALDLTLPPGARIGYVGGGSDRVGLWLRRMGLDVTEFDAQALSGDLSGYTTIVVGIFAFGARPDLAAATGKLHRWVEAGGNLLTLYHRPSDGWNPETTPLRRLVIGSPSVRWRVTDPTAQVATLQLGHPLLAYPNAIGPADWAGWEKERGLYFAAEWDPAYAALIALHDPGEAPLRGALLSARIGRGRHTHTSLVLHYQLDRLVAGAFRLMANLVQPEGRLPGP